VVTVVVALPGMRAVTIGTIPVKDVRAVVAIISFAGPISLVTAVITGAAVAV
jgi:hypothetical protein